MLTLTLTFLFLFLPDQRSKLVFGTTAFATIDEALEVAKKGDTLYVQDGRYTIDIATYYNLLSTITIKGVSTGVRFVVRRRVY